MIDEVRPGLGGLDYGAFLDGQLDLDTPLMLEHLADEREYCLAAAHMRGVAEKAGIAM